MEPMFGANVEAVLANLTPDEEAFTKRLAELATRTAYLPDDAPKRIWQLSELASKVANLKLDYMAKQRSYLPPIYIVANAWFSISASLTLLATECELETRAKFRFCDNQTILWLLQILLKYCDPSITNVSSLIKRWAEKVELWMAHNYHGKVYMLANLHSSRAPMFESKPTTERANSEGFLPTPEERSQAAKQPRSQRWDQPYYGQPTSSPSQPTYTGRRLLPPPPSSSSSQSSAYSCYPTLSLNYPLPVLD